MTYNLKALQRKHESVSGLPSQNRGGSKKFPWVNPGFLEDGQPYLFRLLPPSPEKNPHGIHFYITYELPLDQDGKSRAKKFPSCSLFGKEQDPIIEMFNQITDEEGNLESEIASSLSSDALARINECAPKIVRLIPILLQAKVETTGQFPKFFPSDDPADRIGAILSLKVQPSMDELYDSILERIKEYPDLSDLEDGRWMQLTRKKWSYKIVMDSSDDITGHAELAAYPNLAGYGAKDKKDRASTLSLLQSTWAYQQLDEVVELEFS